MNTETSQGILAWFRTFTAGYAEDGGPLHPLLQLKLDHSRRVAGDSLAIAIELGWDEDAQRTAEIAGLLHDAGRFPQFARYRTFFDPSSLNHGECGYHTVTASGALGACAAADAAAILDSIRYHNRRQIPGAVAEASLRFLRLVRDADKLDILFVVNDTILNNRHKEHPEILLNITLEGPPTPELVREIMETRSGSYENIKTLADMSLMRLSWIHDVNYVPTLRRIADRRLLDDACAALPKTPDIETIIANTKRHMEGKLSPAGSSRSET